MMSEIRTEDSSVELPYNALENHNYVTLHLPMILKNEVHELMKVHKFHLQYNSNQLIAKNQSY